tara:strand:+ start:743 stop:1318 length:576 start_codon:yes stop_codon:yes gene_type:complete
MGQSFDSEEGFEPLRLSEYTPEELEAAAAAGPEKSAVIAICIGEINPFSINGTGDSGISTQENSFQLNYVSLPGLNSEGNASGIFRPKISLQKLVLDGLAYELQGVYGGKSNGNNDPSDGDAEGASGGAVDNSSELECVICLTDPRDTIIMPCRHECLCRDCAEALRTQTNRCPMCRGPIESMIHLQRGEI